MHYLHILAFVHNTPVHTNTSIVYFVYCVLKKYFCIFVISFYDLYLVIIILFVTYCEASVIKTNTYLAIKLLFSDSEEL